MITGISAQYHLWAFDVFGHISAVKKLSENSTVTPYDAYYSSYFNEKEFDQVYAFNEWELLTATIVKISTKPVNKIWPIIAGCLIPIFFSSFFFLSRALFNDERIALIVTFFCFIYWYILEFFRWGMIYFITAPEPGVVASFSVLLMAVGLFLHYLHTEKGAYLLLCAVTAAILPYFHPEAMLYFFLFLGYFFIVALIPKIFKNSKYWKNTLYTMLLTIGLSIVFLSLPIKLYLYLQHPIPSMSKFSFEGNINWININKYLKILNPRYTIFTHLIFVFSLFSLPILLRSKISTTSRMFLTSAMLGSFLICYNPILAPLFTKIFTYAITYRIVALPMHPFVFAYVGFFFSEVIRERIRLPERKTWVLLGYITIAIMCISSPRLNYFKLLKNHLTNRAWVENRLWKEKTPWIDITREDQKDFYKYVNSNIPLHSMIFTDLKTSWNMGAFTNLYFNMAREAQTISDGIRREQGIEKIYAEDTPPEEIKNILKEYETDYLVLDYEDYPQCVDPFDRLFPRIFQGSKYIIYQVK